MELHITSMTVLLTIVEGAGMAYSNETLVRFAPILPDNCRLNYEFHIIYRGVHQQLQ